MKSSTKKCLSGKSHKNFHEQKLGKIGRENSRREKNLKKNVTIEF
jgi:hypothetical protein